MLAGTGLSTRPAPAQAPLRFVNSETTVKNISFRFVDHQTFETARLREQIATTAPGFLAGLRNGLSFLPGLQAQRFPFDPVTLQKDVVRLRRFYRQNGFPNPDIDYPASQLDTTRNRIHVVFTIREGPFLTIRDLAFQNAEGTEPVDTSFPPTLRANWRTFQAEQIQPEGRYTDFKRTQIENQIQSWFRNRGFAFAQTQSSVEVDTAANAVDLRFSVDPGPRAVVSEIQIEGTQSVNPSVIRRELPFSIGDRFSAEEVTNGQQKLFDLNLFRVALADVPDQPRDSTVVVRYRVREAKMRTLSGQVGFGTQSGLSLEGSWRHRNFFGNARTFIVGLVADTGFPENPPSFIPSSFARAASQELSRRFRASVTLREPYLFTNRLSGSIAPFAQARLNPALAPNPDQRLSLNERQYGLTSTLVYDFLPYRALSLQYSFSRTQQFLESVAEDGGDPDDPLLTGDDDQFNKSVFTLNGTFGDADNFANPTEGLLFRPSVQTGGLFFGSGVEFFRASGELSGYLPLSEHVELAGRLFAGALWPIQASRENLTLPPSPTDEDLRGNRIYQNRFSDFLFFAGGSSDVRGWVSRLAGGKVLRESPILRDQFVYRPIGAQKKIGLNLEARLPFPGLGENWRTAAFVDGAYVTTGPLDLTPSPLTVPSIVPAPDGGAIQTDPSQLLVGSGVGLRYQTSFGFLRVDVAYKLTPDALDLRSARAVGEAATGDDPIPLSEVKTRPLRRFRLHFGIGRSF